MNNVIAQPETVDQLRSVIMDQPRVMAVGNQTKLPLSGDTGAQLVSIAKYTGITQYEPSEFTFTARAGTRISEITTALADKGQYLPFDPMLAEQGATIGGTVAAGLSGPGRQRYGGIRDFLLGVQFLSSDGALIHSGGKVVKNAAGFDIPKLMVGSVGRLGIMTELTFKVFPRPQATTTLRVACESPPTAVQRISRAANSRWELDAIDYVPGDGMFIRIGGPADANDALAAEIKSEWTGDVDDVEPLTADTFWQSVLELQPRNESTAVAKLPCTSQSLVDFQSWCGSRSDVRVQFSVAGAVAWVWLETDDAHAALNEHLAACDQSALLVIGKHDQGMWMGTRTVSEMETRIHEAMDPAGKFPAIE